MEYITVVEPNMKKFLPEKKQSSNLKPYSEKGYQDLQNTKNSKVDFSNPTITILTCGHVDAGKSTLVGNLIYKLGLVNKQEMHKINKESSEQQKQSFRFAWLFDKSKEERDRGVTVGVGTKLIRTKSRNVLLLDCPGHKDFVPNLLAEASFADFAILVVDASRGNFESGFADKGQTKEHSILVRSFGVSKIIVAVNKMDLVGWSEERYNQILNTMKEFLLLQNFKKIFFIPISGLEGQNVTENYLKTEWNEKIPNCLLEVIESIKPPKRAINKASRFCVSAIDHSFQYGSVAYGKVVSGSIMVDEKLLVMPINYLVKVNAINNEISYDSRQEIAMAGDNVELAFSNDKGLVKPGFVVCDSLHPIPVLTEFLIKVVTLKMDLPIIMGQKLFVHVHTDTVVCSVKKIVKLIDPRTKKVLSVKPKCLTSSKIGHLVLIAEREMCLETEKSNKNLSRVILRRNGDTVAVGVVSELLK